MAHRKASPGTYKVRDLHGTYRTIEIDDLLVIARNAALERFVEQPKITSHVVIGKTSVSFADRAFSSPQ